MSNKDLVKQYEPTMTDETPSECLTRPDYWMEQSDRGEIDPCGFGRVSLGLAAGFGA